MKILITGGAGFIGYHVAARMYDLGHQIAVLDNFNDFYDPSIKRRNVRDLGPVTLFEADILDRATLERIFSQVKPDAVIHLAAMAGVRPSFENPELYSRVNVTGTANLLEAARKCEVGSLIFGSSSSVYGANANIPFSENDPADRPISPYAATKRAGELLCRAFSSNYGIHVTCLRFFTVYGPRQRPEMAVHKFATLIDEGKEVTVFGSGESRRDYTYIDDIIAGVVEAVRVNPCFEIINLGEAQTVSLLELINELQEALGKTARVTFLPRQPGDMEVTCADIRKAREILGYRPSTPFRDGVRKFVAWFLESRR